MGGAAAAVGVGVAIMTGGIGAGLAVAGIAAYAGGKTGSVKSYAQICLQALDE